MCANGRARTILIVANLSRSAQAVELDLSEWRGRQVVEVLAVAISSDRRQFLSADPAGLHLLLVRAAAAADWEAAESLQVQPRIRHPVMSQGWGDLFTRHNRPQLERDVIPGFLPRQRWFAAKDQRIRSACVVGYAEVPAAELDQPRVGRPAICCKSPKCRWRAGGAAVRPAGSGRMGACRQRSAPDIVAVNAGRTAAIATRGGVGRRDVAGTASRWRSWRNREGGTDTGAWRRGCLRRDPVPPYAAIRRGGETERLVVRRPVPSNRTARVLFEEYAVLKMYRRLQPGPHPEIEMGRFLVERAGFANTPPLLATIDVSLPKETEQKRRPRHWACCSASCATRATAGPWRSITCCANLDDAIERSGA